MAQNCVLGKGKGLTKNAIPVLFLFAFLKTLFTKNHPERFTMIKRKLWHAADRSDPDGAVAAIAARLGVGFPTALLLWHRGYKTPDAAAAFIHLETEILRDPFLLPDMIPACERIVAALDKQEKIVIYGDYDVDGVTAVSLLTLYLREKGGAVDYYIPNRLGEGYGVNREAVKTLVENGASLIITVDTGVTALDEVAYAASLGCDVVVTDHHECRELLPKAVAVVNPHRPDNTYPFTELAGVGVAFKLVTALEMTLQKRNGGLTVGFLSDLCRRYIDLVALGTVADVMPLVDENRLIVSMGLRYMEQNARPGIRALLELADGGKKGQKKRMTSSVISFALAPRINAAGRISTASRAVELFLTEDREQAVAIATELCEINRRRQAEENKIVEQITARILEDPDVGKSPVIVLHEDGWNHGVIGIVSSRITEKYNRPSILISFDGEMGKGSGRSVKGLNLVEALTHCSDLLVKYGGHELAAGLTVTKENLPAFRQRLCDYAREHLGDEEPTVTLEIDCELYPGEISLRQAEELNLLEPCGTMNPVPLFLMSDLEVLSAVPIGAGHHTKLLLEGEGRRFSAVCFGSSPEELGFAAGDRCDIAFNLNVNEFQGSRSEQLVIRDMRHAAEEEARFAARLSDYQTVRESSAPLDASLLPKREDFVSVYLRLKRIVGGEEGTVCLHTFLYELNNPPAQNGPMTYTRLRLCLDILADAGVISLTEKDLSLPARERFTVSIPNLEQKVNLEKSCLFKQLTARTTMPV
ncbi:MAG: single-stranded-DNA-specific exonuclease RecJ [Ruminococcaceae bacterium]|nr:single-stranded-DNA-specific exonuclease RecJ [Oscillospiraceae bacterium]